jgi:hypothetical protein
MPTLMMNASVLAAPLHAHRPKGIALFWLSQQTAIMARFLLICLQARHL